MLPLGLLPAIQFEQASLPVKSLYVPFKHCTHVPPSGPVDPVLQTQAVTAVLPAGELENARQDAQLAVFVVPFLYVPPEHCEHVPPTSPVNLVYPALH